MPDDGWADQISNETKMITHIYNARNLANFDAHHRLGSLLFLIQSIPVYFEIILRFIELCCFCGIEYKCSALPI